jgi:hypothetical protein
VKLKSVKASRLALTAASVGAVGVILAGCSSSPNPYVSGRDVCGTKTVTSIVDGKKVTTTQDQYCAVMSDGDQVLVDYLIWRNLMMGSTLQYSGTRYVYIAPTASSVRPAPMASYDEDDTPVSESSEETEESDDSTWDDGGVEYGTADPHYSSDDEGDDSGEPDDGTTDEGGDRYSDDSGDSSDDSGYSDDSGESDDSGYSDSGESDDG